MMVIVCISNSPRLWVDWKSGLAEISTASTLCAPIPLAVRTGTGEASPPSTYSRPASCTG